jgi:flavin-dependent dehydrogenase
MADVATQRARPKLPGVLYLGDACGTIEPLAGQGMAMALVSATLAERLLIETGGEPLSRATQVAYDAAWDAQFAANVRRAFVLGWLLRRPRLVRGMTSVVWSDLARRIFGSMCHGVALAAH